MKGVAIERWGAQHSHDVFKWMNDTFGPQHAGVWYVEYDYDLHSLIMTDEMFVMYLLRWE